MIFAEPAPDQNLAVRLHHHAPDATPYKGVVAGMEQRDAAAAASSGRKVKTIPIFYKPGLAPVFYLALLSE